MKSQIKTILLLNLCLISILMIFIGCGGSGGTYQIETPPPPPPGVVLSSPALLKNRIFIGSPEGYLHAFNSSGTHIWSYDTLASIESSPAVSSDGDIYFGSNNGNIYSLYEVGNLGGPRWVYPTNGAVRSSPSIDHLGRIWIGSDDGYLYSIKADGELHLSIDTGAPIRSNPAIYGDAAVFVGNNAGKLLSFDLSGQQRFSFTSGTAPITSGPVIDGLANSFYGTEDGRLISLDKNGNFRWSFQTGGAIYSSPALDIENNLYFGSNDQNIYALTNSGLELWNYQTDTAVRSSPALFAQSSIIVGLTDQTILQLSTQGSMIQSFATTSAIHSSPLIVDQVGVYVGHFGKKIHKIDANLMDQDSSTISASKLPWSKYRGATNNPGHIECLTADQILNEWETFGPQNSWVRVDATSQFRSTVNTRELSGIKSDIELLTYSVEANLYATTATSPPNHDNDTISVIAAAKTEGSTIYVIEAVRSGMGGRGNREVDNLHWGFFYSEVDMNTNQTLKRDFIEDGNNELQTLEGYWSCDSNPSSVCRGTTPDSGYQGGTTVRVVKNSTGLSAIASPLHTSTPQALITSSKITLNWSDDPARLNRFSSATSFGFGAFSQSMATFRNVNINGTSTCAIEANN